MILTVTPNTGLDRVLFLDALRPDRRNQVDEWVDSMGGKGCDVSLFLAELGEETVATGLAAGENGHRMEAMLRRGGVTPDFVWTHGETRQNTVIIERETGRHTTLCLAGLRPDDTALDALLAQIGRWAPASDVVVIAGSLPESWPASVYAKLVGAARATGKPVIVDATGPALRAALSVGVNAIKPNRDEAQTIAGPISGEAERHRALAALRDAGAERVLLSLGPDGALYATPRGTWRAAGLSVDVVNPAGAGDGMTACLAIGLARGWDDADTLRWAIAVSAAVVGMRGTAELRRSDALALLHRVQVTRLE